MAPVGRRTGRAGDGNGSGAGTTEGDGESATLGLMSGGPELLMALAKDSDVDSDPLVRQDLARLYTLAVSQEARA